MKKQQEEKVNKKLAKQWLVVIVLAVFIVVTIGISLAFWAVGISSGVGERNPSINIGTAERTYTQVSLSEVQDLTSGRLVPQAIPLTEGTTHTVEFSKRVVWQALEGQQNAINVTGVIGNLIVELDSVMVGGINFRDTHAFRYRDEGQTELEYRYHTDASLFEVDIIAPDFIVGNCTIGAEVRIVIRMNIPRDGYTYDVLAGSDALFSFAFRVVV